MLKRLFTKKVEQPSPVVNARPPFPSTHREPIRSAMDHAEEIRIAVNRSIQRPNPTIPGTAMDSSIRTRPLSINSTVNDSIFIWYAASGFIGYPTAAIVSQHWLISKACLMPAEDAVRNGYKITVNGAQKVDSEVMDALRNFDVEYKINENLTEFIQFGRVFGVRIALFQVESDDPNYYEYPFNPDGIKPGTYRGISQIDPTWVAPELDGDAAGNPASQYFQEPTWWIINGKRHHRSHIIVYRTEKVADILKPTYQYGGIPVPQKILERVYSAERTANEAPMLALTKRTVVLKTDTAQWAANPQEVLSRVGQASELWNNYGTRAIGLDEDLKQFDTTLSDLDAVIMTQYQIVSAASSVPAVKLMGTSPKGFNATGEYEESNYHEFLSSIQAHGLTPLLDRHYLMLMRSEIAPMFGIAPFMMKIEWNPLDEMTAKEKAEVNEINSRAGTNLISSGAIDGEDERQRVINDPESGYSGMVDRIPEEVDDDPESE